MRILRAFTVLLALPALACAAADGGGPASATRVANGAFDVRFTPAPAGEPDSLPRAAFKKTFHGALEATSTGEMISLRSPVPGSAGYVAMETVRGTLDGRAGSFVLQHSATMTRGAPTQSVTVVPDSGTGELAGLAGRMTIEIAPGGAHAWRFEYTLIDPAR